jgi:hypothetical protein
VSSATTQPNSTLKEKRQEILRIVHSHGAREASISPYIREQVLKEAVGL